MIEFLSLLALFVSCKLLQFSLFEKSALFLFFIICLFLKYEHKDKNRFNGLKKMLNKNLNVE